MSAWSSSQRTDVFFSSLRSEDDPATERKVASVLATVNEIKRKPAESVEVQKEKVRPGADGFLACSASTRVLVRKKRRYRVAERLPPPDLHLGLRSRGEVFARETGIPGKRNV